MNSRQGLVYIAFNRWDTIQQRSHHLAQRLSRRYQVLYVDPVAYSILGYIRHRLAGQPYRNLRPRLRTLQPGLSVFTPPPMLPFSMDNEFINRLDHLMLGRMVQNLLRRLKMSRPVLWLTHPLHLPLVGALGEALICYDCMDNYPAFYPPGSRRARLTADLEQRLAARADLVMATASTLQRRLQANRAEVHLVRNAVDEQFLAYRAQPLPLDWPAGSGPVLGYAGSVADWLDLEVIVQLARRHPDWRLVFVGPVEVNLSVYQVPVNLYFLGPKPYQVLPAYMARFDIGLIPFQLNELTRSVNPVKLYEYFALGKPVVAACLPELEPFREVCYLAEGPEEFILQAERSVQDLLDPKTGRQQEAQRQALARANTWGKRVTDITQLLDRQLMRKQQGL